MRIRVGTFLVASCLAGLVATGCGARPASSPAQQSDIALPQGEHVDLALARDGTVWITDSYGSIVRVDETGRVTEQRLQWDAFPGDIVEGPDGAMWFGTDGTLSQIDSNGHITSSGISAWPRVLTSADGALWFVDSDSTPPRAARVDGGGNVTRNVSLSVQPTDFDFGGLAAGPDDSLWFTESSYSPEKHDAVGRVTAEGAYERWRLPRLRSSPGRITEGPDGALWFTEELGHRIGRITADGKIAEYELHPEVNPTDIVVGRDDALWFTSDTCIGRITTDGDIVLWPVDRARGLVRMEAAPDGSFWLLDAVGDALRHFSPPEPAVASRAECEPPSTEEQAEATRAILTYKPLDQLSSGEDFFTDARVRILRQGKEVFREAVPQEDEYSVYGYSRGLTVRDLDGDGEPEVKLELNWNGTHCCEWSRIYRYDPSRGTYVTSTHMWGEAYATPSLKDLDDDGRPEFLSKDDRFSALTGYAGVRAPIQVWSYDQGKFTDVTRRFPKEIERDAAVLWQDYLKYRKRGARYVLAAWAADEYMLGRVDTVESVLAAALERRELDPEGADYLRMLKGFLRRAGYS
jgi:streptogramin lyase